MQRARVRLIVAAVLFVGWIGWLAYLAATATQPVVLSRPQCLWADVHVVAILSGEANPNAKVFIKQVLFGADTNPKLLADAEIEIQQLEIFGAAQGWEGQGEYLLLLSKAGPGYVVTQTPDTPGFDARDPGKSHRIYVATPQVLEQRARLMKKQP